MKVKYTQVMYNLKYSCGCRQEKKCMESHLCHILFCFKPSLEQLVTSFLRNTLPQLKPRETKPRKTQSKITSGKTITEDETLGKIKEFKEQSKGKSAQKTVRNQRGKRLILLLTLKNHPHQELFLEQKDYWNLSIVYLVQMMTMIYRVAYVTNAIRQL